VRKELVWIAKSLSLVLLVLIAAQARSLIGEKDPLEGLSGDHLTLAPPAAGKSLPPPPSASTPEGFKVLDQSGIFGRVPDKPPPALLGVVGKYALIQAPSGKSGMAAEGGEVDGIKVLRIATNRVLIEYQGKQEELVIFSGIGSSSLLPQAEEKKQ
jgi:hypothetical protein